MHADIERVLIPEERIVEALDRVAAEITAAYGDDLFTVVGVLKGAAVFVSDLIRRIPSTLELSFLSASSYRDKTESGELELNFLPTHQEIAGRRLLLVDDILDTGRTMATLKRELLERGALEVRSCVFLDKPARRAVEHEADFRCFEVEDLFVVGKLRRTDWLPVHRIYKTEQTRPEVLRHLRNTRRTRRRRRSMKGKRRRIFLVDFL